MCGQQPIRVAIVTAVRWLPQETSRGTFYRSVFQVLFSPARRHSDSPSGQRDSGAGPGPLGSPDSKVCALRGGPSSSFYGHRHVLRRVVSRLISDGTDDVARSVLPPSERESRSERIQLPPLQPPGDAIAPCLPDPISRSKPQACPSAQSLQRDVTHGLGFHWAVVLTG